MEAGYVKSPEVKMPERDPEMKAADDARLDAMRKALEAENHALAIAPHDAEHRRAERKVEELETQIYRGQVEMDSDSGGEIKNGAQRVEAVDDRAEFGAGTPTRDVLSASTSIPGMTATRATVDADASKHQPGRELHVAMFTQGPDGALRLADKQPPLIVEDENGNLRSVNLSATPLDFRPQQFVKDEHGNGRFVKVGPAPEGEGAVDIRDAENATLRAALAKLTDDYSVLSKLREQLGEKYSEACKQLESASEHIAAQDKQLAARANTVFSPTIPKSAVFFAWQHALVIAGYTMKLSSHPGVKSDLNIRADQLLDFMNQLMRFVPEMQTINGAARSPGGWR